MVVFVGVGVGVGVICCFGVLSETMGFFAGSAAWTAEIEGTDLGLTEMEGWWGLMKDCV